MNLSQFVAKWRGATLKERSAAREQWSTAAASSGFRPRKRRSSRAPATLLRRGPTKRPAEGFAVGSSYFPDVAYIDAFTHVQDEATLRNAGLWEKYGGPTRHSPR